MKSHVTKSSLLKNYVGLDFETFQKQRYILKTSLQGSLGRKKASQIGFSKIKPEGVGQENIGDENAEILDWRKTDKNGHS